MWTKVRWTQARQIVALIDPDDEALPSASISPKEHFAELVAAGRREEALTFLGVALSRLDAINWSIRATIASGVAADQPSAAVRASIEAWLRDPNDTLRRASWTAGGEAGERSPERMLGHAVFMSGGSIAPEDMPPVHPAQELTGKFAAAAVICAAHRHQDPAVHLDRALAEGELFAQGAA